MPRPIFFLALLLLIGCASSGDLIGEKQARDLALQASNNGRLTVLQPPQSVRAELITLAAARERFGASLGNRNALTPDTMVWVITMEGAWEIIGGPPPPIATTPAPRAIFHHCTVVLDARTGEEISLTASVALRTHFEPRSYSFSRAMGSDAKPVGSAPHALFSRPSAPFPLHYPPTTQELMIE